jgi:hypothetical protein
MLANPRSFGDRALQLPLGKIMGVLEETASAASEGPITTSVSIGSVRQAGEKQKRDRRLH